MKPATGVFDAWLIRRDIDAIRFLLLYTSRTKADRYFNGGRFWQVPSNFVRENETIEDAIIRRLGELGLTAVTIWAGQHTYVIHNRRIREMHLVGVYAAETHETEIQSTPKRTFRRIHGTPTTTRYWADFIVQRADRANGPGTDSRSWWVKKPLCIRGRGSVG